MDSESGINPIATPEVKAYSFEEFGKRLAGIPLDDETPPDSSESSQDDDQASETTDHAEAEPDENLAPMSVKDMAGKLGISPQKLYKLLQIDAGDGTSFSLGEYKDKAKEFRQMEQLQAKATQDRLKSETDLLQKSMALDEATARLGRPLSQQDFEAVKQKQALHNQAQTALLAEIVPEFADPVARDKGFQVITETLKDYAFSEAQIPYITDARLRKMAFDLGKLRQQLASVADAEVKPKVRQAPKPVTANVKSLSQQVQTGRLKQDAAVRELGKLL
jgi:hypothetical protein